MEIVNLELTHQEALVLYEWLVSMDGKLPVNYPAEQTVLWRIEGKLETFLTEPFLPNYQATVTAARIQISEPDS